MFTRCISFIGPFDVNLTSFIGGVMNSVLTVKFVSPPGDEVRLTSKFTGASVYEDL